jgi:hypothetical protein
MDVGGGNKAPSQKNTTVGNNSTVDVDTKKKKDRKKTVTSADGFEIQIYFSDDEDYQEGAEPRENAPDPGGG